jgi:hypothetical protein
MTPEQRAELLLWLIPQLDDAERIATLQALQRLCQEELARLWAERNDSPGHVLKESEPALFTRERDAPLDLPPD